MSIFPTWSSGRMRRRPPRRADSLFQLVETPDDVTVCANAVIVSGPGVNIIGSGCRSERALS